ncbi:MAG: hypothetical protein H7A51_03755 [Akkermansiaceae bacterium]|nr:hypothetical protein [Akkermansiaceae bacterium]
MDTKCRVSIPSEWRSEIANSVLRLMVSSNEGFPTLRVLTEAEFEKMQQEVHDSQRSPADKRNIIGIIFERCTQARVNDQGKLTIPKALLDHPGLVPGDGLVLCGRGNFIEILNEENHQKLRGAHDEKIVEDYNAEFGFF